MNNKFDPSDKKLKNGNLGALTCDQNVALSLLYRYPTLC